MSYGVPRLNPLEYSRQDYTLVPTVSYPREPLSTDVNFQIVTVWRVGRNPTTGIEGDIWILIKKTGAMTNQVATWVKFTSALGDLLALEDPQGTIVEANSEGLIQFTSLGNTVAIVADPTNHTMNMETVASAPPNAVINVFDDFVGMARVTQFTSQQGWSSASFTNTNQSDSAHPGVVSNAVLNSGSTDAHIFLGNNSDLSVITSNILGGGAITLNWVIKLGMLSNGTNRYTARIGFGDTKGADQVNGVYFEYSDNENSGNWLIKTANSSTRTATNTSTAADTGYHNFQISINAAGTSAQFFIDGVSQGTITTNIPTAAITPFVDILWSSGTIAVNSVLIDLFYMTQILTTPR